MIFKNILLAAISVMVVCCAKVNDKENNLNNDLFTKEKLEQNIFGTWYTSSVENSNTSILFDVKIENLKNTKYLVISNFAASASPNGQLVGSYFPQKYKIVKINNLDSYSIPFNSQKPSDVSYLVAETDISNSRIYGWISDNYQSFAISDQYHSHMNGLRFYADYDGSELNINQLDFRWKAKSFLGKISVKRASLKYSEAIRDLLWSQMKVPNSASLSTNTGNQNYLYCTSYRDPKGATLVDFKSSKYKVGDRHIGEIGSLAIDDYNKVYMARTDYGSYTIENDLTTYNLYLTIPGGNTKSISITTDKNGFGVLEWGELLLCRFLSNDIFSGYNGWNP